jgi:hypothetical protein
MNAMTGGSETRSPRTLSRAASLGPFPKGRCTVALHFRSSVEIMSVEIMSVGIMSVGIIVVDRIQAETPPFLSDGSPVPAYEPHVPRSAVLNKKPVTHRVASHRFRVAPRVILNNQAAACASASCV